MPDWKSKSRYTLGGSKLVGEGKGAHWTCYISKKKTIQSWNSVLRMFPFIPWECYRRIKKVNDPWQCSRKIKWHLVSGMFKFKNIPASAWERIEIIWRYRLSNWPVLAFITTLGTFPLSANIIHSLETFPGNEHAQNWITFHIFKHPNLNSLEVGR